MTNPNNVQQRRVAMPPNSSSDRTLGLAWRPGEIWLSFYWAFPAGELMILDEQGKFIGYAEAPFPVVVRAFMGNQPLATCLENGVPYSGRLFVFDLERLE